MEMNDDLYKEKGKCCGCAACVNICPRNCISMKVDSEGFEYPQVDKTNCINCNLCEKTCPMLHSGMNKSVQLAYAAISKREEIRLKSSSGGLFYVLAEYVISQGGVVFGASLVENSKRVNHIAIECIEDLRKLQKSKYVQSEIGTTYMEAKRILDTGRLVLFSGTPCQIKGLSFYLNKNYDNLISVDIICHGVPSPGLWEKYISSMEKSGHINVSKVIFRYKISDWKELGVHKIDSETCFTCKLKHTDPFIQMFLKNYSLRPSCYACNVKKNKVSDITLGDFWGVEKICPEINDGKGVSLVLVRSSRGKELINEVHNRLLLKQVSYEAAIKYNSAEYSSVKIPTKRADFFRDMNILEFKKLSMKYFPLSFKDKVLNVCSNSKLYRYFKPKKEEVSNYDWCIVIEQRKRGK